MLNFLFFSISLFAGVAMVVEGYAIFFTKKPVTPLPTRILHGLSLLAAGNAKTTARFTGRTTPDLLRKYAASVLIFGPLLIISSFIYLFNHIL